MADEIRNDDDNIQHGIDDNPSGDAEKGAALGGVGGIVTGAVAGSVAGPAGAIVGAVVGGVVGAAASGAAVAAVDKHDDDDSVSGFGEGVDYDHRNRSDERADMTGISENSDVNRPAVMGSGVDETAGNLDTSNSMGMGIREATNFTSYQSEQESDDSIGSTAMGDRGSSEVNAGDWDQRRTDAGVDDQRSDLTDLGSSRTSHGTSDNWQGETLSGTEAGSSMAGTGEGGWERDNDANTIDVNPAPGRHVNTPDANEGGSYAYADEEVEKGHS